MFLSATNRLKQFGLPLMAASVVVGGIAASPAQAMNVVQKYSVTSAFTDSYAKYGGGHTIASFLGNTYITTSDEDLWWEEYDDGSVRFYGDVYQKNNLSNGWTIDIYLDDLPGPGTGGPKLELKDEAYVDGGGPVDPETWSFYAFESTEFKGFGDYVGRTLTIEDKTNGKYPVQVGYGANGKNVNLGMSTWFNVYENGDLVDGHADFNVDLEVVPTPATGLAWLFTSAAAIARKRKEERENEA